MKIAGPYTCDDWSRVSAKLDPNGIVSGAQVGDAWLTAIKFIRVRIETRFLNPARKLLTVPYAGFVLLVIDSLLIEYLQRLRSGERETGSRRSVTTFLLVQPSFSAFRNDAHFDQRDCPCLACDFYRSVRSGIAHFGETFPGWLVDYGKDEMLTTPTEGARVVDRNRFHAAVEAEFESYLTELEGPTASGMRRHLKNSLDTVCGFG